MGSSLDLGPQVLMSSVLHVLLGGHVQGVVQCEVRDAPRRLSDRFP